ncbi:hypothetical protein [Iodidimonas nitroreducens]|uniref:hypothetical protein n=1 Tax=Iodidimonas nitroreducens TaxID=1236968 RepID=UPI001230B855|nr:hypothetical protein [Iodidimonas nitroreducens]
MTGKLTIEDKTDRSADACAKRDPEQDPTAQVHSLTNSMMKPAIAADTTPARRTRRISRVFMVMVFAFLKEKKYSFNFDSLRFNSPLSFTLSWGF